MDNVCKENFCSGCMACKAVCPKGAISVVDSLHAYNTEIDSEKCINCNRCFNVCQQNIPPELFKPFLWKQGWIREKSSRSECSSGGAATALMIAAIRQGGVVCSCTGHAGEYIFEFADKETDIKKFRGSKYVKSNPENIYREVIRRLSHKQQVLFIGLPCQVAGVLKAVPDKMKAGLYTVDLICHGTPSPKLLELFLRQYGNDSFINRKIAFRQGNQFTITADNVYLEPKGIRDRYTTAFLKGLSYTENCYSCKYATNERISDITIGDAWGSQLPTAERLKGVSLILCQTEKGRSLLEYADLELLDIDLEEAINANNQLKHPMDKPGNREAFFNAIQKGKSFNKAVAEAYPILCIKQDIKKTLLKMGLLK